LDDSSELNLIFSIRSSGKENNQHSQRSMYTLQPKGNNNLPNQQWWRGAKQKEPQVAPTDSYTARAKTRTSRKDLAQTVQKSVPATGW
jgi:hypothetical protein